MIAKKLPEELKQLFPHLTETELLFVISQYWSKMSAILSKNNKDHKTGYVRFVLPHVGVFSTDKRRISKFKNRMHKNATKMNHRAERAKLFTKENILF